MKFIRFVQKKDTDLISYIKTRLGEIGLKPELAFDSEPWGQYEGCFIGLVKAGKGKYYFVIIFPDSIFKIDKYDDYEVGRSRVKLPSIAHRYNLE